MVPGSWWLFSARLRKSTVATEILSVSKRGRTFDLPGDPSVGQPRRCRLSWFTDRTGEGRRSVIKSVVNKSVPWPVTLSDTSLAPPRRQDLPRLATQEANALGLDRRDGQRGPRVRKRRQCFARGKDGQQAGVRTAGAEPARGCQHSAWQLCRSKAAPAQDCCPERARCVGLSAARRDRRRTNWPLAAPARGNKIVLSGVIRNGMALSRVADGPGGAGTLTTAGSRQAVRAGRADGAGRPPVRSDRRAPSITKGQQEGVIHKEVAAQSWQKGGGLGMKTKEAAEVWVGKTEAGVGGRSH